VKPPSGVAIMTYYGTLQDLLPNPPVMMGVVTYIDYDAETLPSMNMLHRIMHKRHFFSDEREVRAVVWSTAPSRNNAPVLFDLR
jgi:hypothetical protein